MIMDWVFLGIIGAAILVGFGILIYLFIKEIK
jgi:hypothetical protein